MKLAEYGELYSFIEHTGRFDEKNTRYILNQMIDGVLYLHSHGIVHRDIKPENLLINRKGKVLIADFSFATRMNELKSNNFFTRKFDPVIEKRHNVGSEMYNAPEIWDSDITAQEMEKKMKDESYDDETFDEGVLDNKLRHLHIYPKYNGVKADVFSCGATLFLVHMQSPPFRKAVQTDPYYKRLSGPTKQNFWKIFKNTFLNGHFKDLIEKMLNKFPSQRFDLEQIKASNFYSEGDVSTTEDFLEEIKQRFTKVEAEKQNDMG